MDDRPDNVTPLRRGTAPRAQLARVRRLPVQPAAPLEGAEDRLSTLPDPHDTTATND